MGLVRRLRRLRFQRPAGRRDLTWSELRFIGHTGECPYCGSTLVEGPEGGMCINLLCRQEGCMSRFNYCGFTGEFIGVEP